MYLFSAIGLLNTSLGTMFQLDGGSTWNEKKITEKYK